MSTFKELWEGTSGLSSLSEKTRKSDHLQMKLPRQHFLLSYLKTVSVGPVGVSNSRPALWQQEPGVHPMSYQCFYLRLEHKNPFPSSIY